MYLVTLNYDNQCSSCVLYGLFDTMYEADQCKLSVCETLWGTFADTQSNMSSGYFFETYICNSDYFKTFMETHVDEYDEEGFIIIYNSEESDENTYKSKREAEQCLKTLIKL